MAELIQNIDVKNRKMRIVLGFEEQADEKSEIEKEIKMILTNELQLRIKERHLL